MNPSTASKRLFSFLVALLFACAIPFASAQNENTSTDEGDATGSGNGDRKPGITVIVDVSGKAEVFESEGKPAVQATKDMRIPVGATIVTGPGARVDLALSNGALFQIQENSQFGIGEFDQLDYQVVFNNGAVLSPTAAKNLEGGDKTLANLESSAEAWNELEAEPTDSKSKFFLGYGTMIGNSKRLAQNSSMEIITPVGSAGVRGTTWRLTVQRVGAPGSNQFNVILQVVEGSMSFGNSAGTRAVSVNPGFMLQASAIMEAPGEIRIERLSNVPMTQQSVDLLQNIVQEINAVQTAFTAVQGNPDIFAQVEAANNAANQGVGDAGRTQSVDLPSTAIRPLLEGIGTVPPTPTPNPSNP